MAASSATAVARPSSQGFSWRAESPPTEPSATLVADSGTHQLLTEVVEELLRMSGGHQLLHSLVEELVRLRGTSTSDVSQASDDSLVRLEGQLALLAEAMEDIASRPIPAPNVEVRSPELPRELTMLPTLLRDLLERPAVSEETLEAIRSIRPAVSVQGGVGTIGLQKVIEAQKAATVDLEAKTPDLTGTWSYVAGTSGTPTITGRVLAITATCTSGAGSFTIDGGDTITVPANTAIAITPHGNLVDPAIVFTGTASFFVEVLT